MKRKQTHRRAFLTTILGVAAEIDFSLLIGILGVTAFSLAFIFLR